MVNGLQNIEVRSAVYINTKFYIYLILGPLFFIGIIYGLPQDSFNYAVRGSIGTMAWMTTWWILRPVNIAISAMLPIVTTSLLGFMPVTSVLENYASPIVILLLGANIITISWSASGLDKRISLRALCLIGPSIQHQIITWFIISTIMTIVLPNVVVAAVLIPISVAMLNYLGMGEDIGKSPVATAIMLAIIYGASLGGFGSPLGGAMNLVSIQHLEEMVLHREYMYINWTICMLPMLVFVSAGVLFLLLRIKIKQKELPGSRQFFLDEYKKLPKMSTAEKWSLTLFLAASLLSFLRPFYAHALPTLKPPYIFLICGLLSFIVPDGKGNRLMTWDYTSPRLVWGLFYLFAGGMAIGKMLTESGAGNILAQAMTSYDLSGGILLIAIFVFLGFFLCNVSSATAACAILVPVVIKLTQTMNLNPIPYVYIASVASNCAILLPTSVGAVAVGYGLDPRELLKKGLVVVVFSFFIVSTLGWLFLTYWPGFSVA